MSICVLLQRACVMTDCLRWAGVLVLRLSRSAGNATMRGRDRNTQIGRLGRRQLLHDASSIVADVHFTPHPLFRLPVQIFGV
jgi:hypothetical protein